MKKIFFMAVSAVLLAAGCQKTEIQNEVLPKIGFDTHLGKLTKADADEVRSGDAKLKEQGFRAWGYFVNENDLNYEKGDLYLHDETEGNEDLGIKVEWTTAWNTIGTHYWPGKGKALDIYSVSLAEDDGNLYTNVDPNWQDFTVTVNDFVVGAEADNDLMVAPLIRQDQSRETVEPVFQHALTKVLLKFKRTNESTKVYLVSAKTSPIPSKGMLVVTNTDPNPAVVDEITPDGTDNGESTTTPEEIDPFSWTLLNGVANKIATYEYEAKDFIRESTVTVNTSDNTTESVLAYQLSEAYTTCATWLLIPQDNIKPIQAKEATATTPAIEATEGYYLDVEYIVENTYIKQRFSLYTNTLDKWARNQQTTYNIIISPDEIRFTPEVEDWVVEEKRPAVNEDRFN